MDDSVLISRYKAGDAEAFETLYDRYKTVMAGYVYALTGSREEADNIVQEVFLAVIRRADSLTPEGNFRAYLLTRARGLALNLKRAKVPESADCPDAVASAPGPAELVENHESAQRLDGGEIGSGHSVTALYEIKFQKDAGKARVASVSVEYTDPDTGSAASVDKEISKEDFGGSFENATADFRLAAAVAEFAEIMRKSYWARGSKFSDVMPVIREVLDARGDDADIIELLDLVSKAHSLSPDEVTVDHKDGAQEDSE